MEQIRRVAEIHNLPPHLLKTIELNLRKDMYEVEKVRSDHSCDHSTNSWYCRQWELSQTSSSTCGWATTDSWRVLDWVWVPESRRAVNNPRLETWTPMTGLAWVSTSSQSTLRWRNSRDSLLKTTKNRECHKWWCWSLTKDKWFLQTYVLLLIIMYFFSFNFEKNTNIYVCFKFAIALV